jgi:hypothetical protein
VSSQALTFFITGTSPARAASAVEKGTQMNISILFVVISILAGACAPAATPRASLAGVPPDSAVTSPAISDPPSGETPELPAYSPQPGDGKFKRGILFISKTDLKLRESFPVQVVLEMSGELPTPCHQLRVIVEPPDLENKILVDTYTVVNPELMCIQVVKPFEETIDLGTFPGGHYTVWVNGEQVGEFDS